MQAVLCGPAGDLVTGVSKKKSQSLRLFSSIGVILQLQLRRHLIGQFGGFERQ
tara:strand:- start:169 stop:327 length:159 start_codon:yes stop_codon:yes gene_type:complete